MLFKRLLFCFNLPKFVCSASFKDFKIDYEQLLKVTNKKTQKAEMKRIHDALVGYNIDFAENYIEEDKDIRAALSFEEVVALSQAYNDFTPKQIKAIFNGKAIYPMLSHSQKTKNK